MAVSFDAMFFVFGFAVTREKEMAFLTDVNSDTKIIFHSLNVH